jgi:hypothetical protein
VGLLRGGSAGYRQQCRDAERRALGARLKKRSTCMQWVFGRAPSAQPVGREVLLFGRTSRRPLPRSPLPLVVSGICVTLLIVAATSLLRGTSEAGPIKTPVFSPEEVLTTVAHEMRSAEAAAQVLAQGEARFNDGTWYISIGEARFHFSQRTRIVVPDNAAAVRLAYRDSAKP